MALKVSVVVGGKDVDSLTRCLDSVLTQTYSNLEIICVIKNQNEFNLPDFLQQEKRLRVIKSADTISEYNRIIKTAAGQFILFLDASCHLEANAIEKMMIAANVSGSDLIICEYGNLSAPCNIKEPHFPRENTPLPLQAQKDIFALIRQGLSNKLIRLNLIRKNNITLGGQNGYVGDVSFLFLCMCYANNILAITDYLLQCDNRVFLSCIERNYRADLVRELEDLYQQLKKRKLENFFKQYFGLFEGYLALMFLTSTRDKDQEDLSFIQKYISKDNFEHVFYQNRHGDYFFKAVSIIVPVYNSGKSLGRCLDSLCNQTLKDIEIICIDDGSQDDSLKILKEYEKKDERIIILHQDHQGQSIALNKGLEIAGGEYIQFADTNDYLAPEACEYSYIYSKILDLDICLLTGEPNSHNKGFKAWEAPNYCLKNLPLNIPIVYSKMHLGDRMRSLYSDPWATFYSHAFLMKYAIHFINKEISYAKDLSFFMTSLLKSNRIAGLTFPLYYYSSASEFILLHKNQALSSDPTYCIQYVLKLIYRLEDKKCFNLFCDYYTKALLDDVKKIPSKDKQSIEKYVCNFYSKIISEYSVVLPKICQYWYQEYLKKRPLKKLSLKLHFLYNNRRNISLRKIFHIQIIPPAKIRLFGISVWSIKTKLTQKGRIQIISIAGVPILKIKEEA